jgi:uncharacterized protein YdhG (YjbR/CyaY superfamily)
MARINRKPQTIDEYFACVNADQRDALQELRQTIQAVAPNAEECISYAIPAFRLNGRLLVGFAAWSKHCSFYPMSSKTLKKFRNELRNFQTSKGTLRFSPDNPMPVALVKKLLKARIAENNARANKTGENREQSQNFSRHKKGRVHPDFGWHAQTMES